MARDETLRAIISASARSLVTSMKSAASATKDVRDAMASTAASSVGAAESMDIAEWQAEAYEHAMDKVRAESYKAITGQGILAEVVRDTGHAMTMAGIESGWYQSRMDEAEDETEELTRDQLKLAAAVRSAAAAFTESSLTMGPFTMKTTRALTILPLVVAVIGSMTVALLGVAAAAVTAGGALAALFAGGMIARAEEMAAANEDLKNTTEALQEMMSQFASALDTATEPLQSMASSEQAMEIMNGLLVLINDLSKSAARLAEVFGMYEDRLGTAFWESEAEGIATVEQAITDMMPILVNLTEYIFRQLPEFIRWTTEVTKELVPVLAMLWNALVPVTAELIELGGTILSIVIPPIAVLLWILKPLMQGLNLIPDAAWAAALAFIGLSIAVGVYAATASAATASTWSLYGAIMKIAKPIIGLFTMLSTGTLIIIGLISAVIGLITYFDLWDDIVNALVGAWNFLLEVIEFFINAVLIALRIVGMFIPGVDNLVWALTHLGEVWEMIGNTVNWVIRMIAGAVRWVLDKLQPLVETIEVIAEMVDDIGGFEIGNEGGGGDEGGEDGGDGGGGGQGGGGQGGGDDMYPDVPSPKEVREKQENYNFDFSGASFGKGMTQRDIELAVEEALDKAQNRAGDT